MVDLILILLRYDCKLTSDVAWARDKFKKSKQQKFISNLPSEPNGALANFFFVLSRAWVERVAGHIDGVRLQWLGLTYDEPQARNNGAQPYPKMRSWLRL